MKTTVIHHSADFDGLFCREIARKFLPDAELIGWDFKDAPLSPARLTVDSPVYVLDLPVDRVFGVSFRPDTQSSLLDHIRRNVIWIDHHKSSIESHPTSIPGYRIDGVAACRLAWHWFTASLGPNNPHCQPADYHLADKQHFLDRKVSEPLAVRLAGEYDIWDKRDPNAEVFQFGLRSREMDETDWGQLLDSGCNESGYAGGRLVAELLQNGILLQGYQQASDKCMMHRSFIAEWEGLKFLALNTARCNSLTFAARDVPETGHDALMGFYFDGQKWNVSLYHAKHRMDLDLSEIAKKHGGGGHRGACGFRVDKLPFVP